MRGLSAFWDWISLADYEKAKEQSARDIASRFSRGNVNVQNGQILDEEDLRLMAVCGDRALARLNDLRNGG